MPPARCRIRRQRLPGLRFLVRLASRWTNLPLSTPRVNDHPTVSDRPVRLPSAPATVIVFEYSGLMIPDTPFQTKTSTTTSSPGICHLHTGAMALWQSSAYGPSSPDAGRIRVGTGCTLPTIRQVDVRVPDHRSDWGWAPQASPTRPGPDPPVGACGASPLRHFWPIENFRASGSCLAIPVCLGTACHRPQRQEAPVLPSVNFVCPSGT